MVSKNIKEIARFYICYGYLIMGIFQYLLVLILNFDFIKFDKLYYVLIALVIYFPIQKIFKKINDKKFSKYINLIALFYGIIIVYSYFWNAVWLLFNNGFSLIG